MADQQVHWKPWDAFEADAELLPITEPPCKHCISWKPMRVHNERGVFAGVRMCIVEKMHRDFSCFASRPR